MVAVYEYDAKNNPMKNVLGFDAEELEGKHFFDFIHPDDVATAIAPFQASLNQPAHLL